MTLLGAACGSDRSPERVSVEGPAPQPAPQQSTFDNVVFEAGGSTLGEASWVLGGHYVASSGDSGVDIAAVREALLYSADGEVLRRAGVPVSGGTFLFSPTVASVGTSTYVGGSECELPRFEPGGCISAGVPVLFRLNENETDFSKVALDLPDAEVADRPGSGHLVVSGSDGETVFLTQNLGPGKYAGTNQFRLLALNATSELVEDISPPTPILTANSVCAAGGVVYVATPELKANLSIAGIDIVSSAAVPQGQRAWIPAGRVKVDQEEVLTTRGGIDCTEAVVAAHLSLSESTLVYTSPSGGRQVLEFGPGESVAGRLTAIRSSARGIAFSSVTENEAVYSVVGDTGGVERIARRPIQGRRLSERIPVGVAVGGGVLDLAPAQFSAPGNRSRPQRID